ncbi:MAG: response regulator receiver protein [Bryobacterales bacterium]|jgi:two-component system, chemotaxis family, chemotaxis protein CheY|nr:response regulator receiver protein [Bryobacterales bacterium]
MPRLILIVEDTATLASSLAVAIEGIGNVCVIVTGDATEALRFLRLQCHPLAAVVTDLNLPDEDGFTLIQAIREMEPYRTVPVILITAQESPRPKEQHMLGSPNAIFQKPFSMKEVRRVLETLL